jgi:hypothetical protein
MFVIRLHCKACSFETDDISTGYICQIAPVWFASYQHQKTRRFRHVSFSDAQVRRHMPAQYDKEETALDAAYERLADHEVHEGESRLRLWLHEETDPTDAVCPQCAHRLFVRYTGIY